MTAGGVAIRAERAEDADAVHALLVAVFDGAAEAGLVRRLRAEGDIALALVEEQGGQVVGHIAFPRLHVDGLPVAGLAPLGVRPDRQRAGIGQRLVETGLAVLKDARTPLVFVLGDPVYYGRFGFSVAAAQGFACVYAGSHFQALRLAGSAPGHGAVRYPPAFDSLA
ncbi:MAG TPA: N-acetyltransferase [Xanthobacteraceae bacterium]|nr:N-acetyltransferase [Xanthobacteraceae bacterium]